MRIVIANTHVPFITGGAEVVADGLKQTLIEAGHYVEIVRIPFKWYPPEIIPEHILACRLLDLTESCGEGIDLFIGLKFPAYYIKHPNKVLWICHQHRPVYDLWDTSYRDIPGGPLGLYIKNTITQSDNNFLREARKIFTISKNVSSRLKKFNNLDSEHLYPPVSNQKDYHCNNAKDYIYYISRIGGLKRQELAVESMKYVKSKARLIIAGSPDSEYNIARLNKLIREYHLNSKVKILPNVSDEEKINLYANCLAVLFSPYDEDYGYITLEAMYSKKPVITCKDSGGPLEFVEDNITGYIREPAPQEIADVIDRLYLDREKAKKLGEAGYEKIISMDISWKRVVETLTG